MCVHYEIEHDLKLHIAITIYQIYIITSQLSSSVVPRTTVRTLELNQKYPKLPTHSNNPNEFDEEKIMDTLNNKICGDKKTRNTQRTL